MINVEKEIKITIDGKEVHDLKDLLECARIYLEQTKNDLYAGGGMDKEHRQYLRNTLSDLQEACS